MGRPARDDGHAQGDAEGVVGAAQVLQRLQGDARPDTGEGGWVGGRGMGGRVKGWGAGWGGEEMQGWISGEVEGWGWEHWRLNGVRGGGPDREVGNSRFGGWQRGGGECEG